MRSGLFIAATSLSILTLSGCVFFHQTSSETQAEPTVAKKETTPSAFLTREPAPSKPISLGVMTLNAAETFAVGSATLSSQGMSGLDAKLVGIELDKVASVSIVGHTDSTGSDSFNMTLSQKRADAVKAYLTSKGISESKISAVGRGETMPFASNDSATGRAQNRRVEVMFEVY